jgi:hypothetical protein
MNNTHVTVQAGVAAERVAEMHRAADAYRNARPAEPPATGSHRGWLRRILPRVKRPSDSATGQGDHPAQQRMGTRPVPTIQPRTERSAPT